MKPCAYFDCAVPGHTLVVRVSHKARAITRIELLSIRKPRTPSVPNSAFEHRIETALRHTFAGKPVAFRFPLADDGTTPFQRTVWRALRKIPYGELRTYGQVAHAIDKPGAARAVGNACGANPWPIIVPCHRVVAANGLGGFSAGLKWKRLLLHLEGRPRDRGTLSTLSREMAGG